MMAPSNSELAAASVAKIRDELYARYDKRKGPVLSLSQRQRVSRIDRGASASLWTSPVTVPVPTEDDALNTVITAIKSLGDVDQCIPSLQAAPISAEWVGTKRGRAKAIAVSPQERYNALTEDTVNPITILFVHGGAFFQNGLGNSRPTAAKLSKESGGRVLVLDYRLAPQHPFPAPILDLFILYVSLLRPPIGSSHGPISASSIVLAGESAGANICLAFMQLLLHLQGQSISFNGQRISVPVPAGIATISCLGDHALCLPSWVSNKRYDIWLEQAPFLDPDFPTDDIWPTSPPREDPYCNAALFHHPMVSPSAAKNWKGAPPMWFGVGEECVADSCKVIAQTAARDGVCIWWEQYEAMPHCWPLLMPRFPHALHAFRSWGESCRRFVKSEDLQTKGVWIGVETLEESYTAVSNLTCITPEEVTDMIKAKAKTRKIFYGKSTDARL